MAPVPINFINYFKEAPFTIILDGDSAEPPSYGSKSPQRNDDHQPHTIANRDSKPTYHISPTLLSTRSPYFKALLDFPGTESHTRIMNLPKVSEDVFDAFVRYLYTDDPDYDYGRKENSEKQAFCHVGLYALGNQFMMDDLKKVALKKMVETLSESYDTEHRDKVVAFPKGLGKYTGKVWSGFRETGDAGEIGTRGRNDQQSRAEEETDRSGTEGQPAARGGILGQTLPGRLSIWAPPASTTPTASTTPAEITAESTNPSTAAATTTNESSTAETGPTVAGSSSVGLGCFPTLSRQTTPVFGQSSFPAADPKRLSTQANSRQLSSLIPSSSIISLIEIIFEATPDSSLDDSESKTTTDPMRQLIVRYVISLLKVLRGEKAFLAMLEDKGPGEFARDVVLEIAEEWGGGIVGYSGEKRVWKDELRRLRLGKLAG